jgi:hypothetical protein
MAARNLKHKPEHPATTKARSSSLIATQARPYSLQLISFRAKEPQILVSSIKAYFSAIVTRGCELEAVLRIFDFFDSGRSKDRCKNLRGLINQVFARHWIPHDALRYWKKTKHTPQEVPT